VIQHAYSLGIEMSFFTKPFSALTIEDLRWLVDMGVRESSDLEFKSFPPNHPEKGNPWVKPDGTITKECKEALLKELVAFANASGGTLVFGILDKDCCAAGITPVPKAEACAEKLKVACRDSIEPTIPQFERRCLSCA
jgi:hypothetical protein